MRLSTLLATLAAAGTASATFNHNSWLDGWRPLDRDVRLPDDAFHHSGAFSARWVDPDLLNTFVRKHERGAVAKRAPSEHIFPPDGCTVTFVSTLQRHGARWPTEGLTKGVEQVSERLAKALKGIPDDKLADPTLGFLRNLSLPPGEEDLVPYGALQAYYSGLFDRQIYSNLSTHKPFVRASGNYGNQAVVPSDRVLYTARWWLQAFLDKGFPDHADIDTTNKTRHITNLPELDVVVSEMKGVNNTLKPTTCPAFTNFESSAPELFTNHTLGRIGKKLSKRLQPANISLNGQEINLLMTFCSFNTLSSANVTKGALELDVSPICHAFDPEDWRALDYMYSLVYYYKFGLGNPYHRAAYQGYLRELYARLNNSAVVTAPATTINTTTLHHGGFPLPGNKTVIHADFTHDNILPIAAAFGLFPTKELPSNADAHKQYKGPFAASKIVPYQTKHAYEKISCTDRDTEYLRVRVNEAVHPVTDSWCPAKASDKGYDHKLAQKGLCPLPTALKNLEWVNGSGEWNKCFNTTA